MGLLAQTLLIFRFDQGVPEYFNGDFKPSINRMSLPSIDSEAQMSSAPGSWVLSAHCSATDFRLSVTPDVAEGVYRLIDLYERGKIRISELEEQYRLELSKREALDSVAAKYEDSQSPVSNRPNQRVMVRMSFIFNSGIVELSPSPSEEDRKTMALDLRVRPSRVGQYDVFTLPTISVWTDYAGPRTDIVEHADGESNQGLLVLNAVSMVYLAHTQELTDSGCPRESQYLTSHHLALHSRRGKSYRRANESVEVYDGALLQSPTIRCT